VSSARKLGTGTRRLRAVVARPKTGAAPEPPAPRASHDLFAERLRALDGMVERAFADSGGAVSGSSWLGEGAEVLLDAYARVARDLERRSLRDLLSGFAAPRSRAGSRGADAFDDSLAPYVAPLLRVLYRTWWRVDVSGMANVPARGGVLLLANHAGGLFAHDAAMLRLALADERPNRSDVVALVDDLASALPVVGDLLRRCGTLPATPAHATRLLEHQHAVIAFPEGTRGIAKPYAERYRVQRFGRDGLVRAAMRTGAPVLPVAVIGAEEAHPVVARADRLGRLLGLPYLPITPTFPWLGVLGLVPLPSKWRIEIGPPLAWSLERNAAAADDRALVRRRAEEARRAVQALVRGAQRRRGAAFL
jgi:1-acyl-sn-glycerol-3-phosphate acyltransferase